MGNGTAAGTSSNYRAADRAFAHCCALRLLEIYAPAADLRPPLRTRRTLSRSAMDWPGSALSARGNERVAALANCALVSTGIELCSIQMADRSCSWSGLSLDRLSCIPPVGSE